MKIFESPFYLFFHWHNSLLCLHLNNYLDIPFGGSGFPVKLNHLLLFQVWDFRAASALGGRTLFLPPYSEDWTSSLISWNIHSFSSSPISPAGALIFGPLSRTPLKALTRHHHTADDQPSAVGHYPLEAASVELSAAFCWLSGHARSPTGLLSFTKARAILHTDNILRLAALQLHLSLLHMGRCTYTPLPGSVHLLLLVSSQFCLVFHWWNNYLPFSHFTSRWANSVTGALLPCDTNSSRSLIFQCLHLAFFITLFEAGLYISIAYNRLTFCSFF